MSCLPMIIPPNTFVSVVHNISIQHQYSDLRLKLPASYIIRVGHSLWGLCREKPVFFVNNKVVEHTTRSACVQLVLYCYVSDCSYPNQRCVEQDADIFSSLSSPSSFLFCPLFPLHSSHSPLFLSSSPCSHQSPYLSSCAHISRLSNMSSSVFFFLSVSVLILLYLLLLLLLLPTALPRPSFCCCNDTDKLFGHSLCLSSAYCSCFFFYSPFSLPLSLPAFRLRQI